MKQKVYIDTSSITDLKLKIIRAVIKTDNIPVLTLVKKQIEQFEKGAKEIKKTQNKEVKPKKPQTKKNINSIKKKI